MRFRLLFLLITLIAALLPAAAVLPVEQPLTRSAEIQPNVGQMKSGILFVTRGPVTGVAAVGSSLDYGASGFHQNFVGGNSAPSVSFSDPLPGHSNEYTGRTGTTGIPRYATARLANVYPGINVSYTVTTSGLMLRLDVAAGVDVSNATFEVPEALAMFPLSDRLVASADALRPRGLVYNLPRASQGTTSRVAAFEVLSQQRFRVQVTGVDAGVPLVVEILEANDTQDQIVDWARSSDGSLTLIATVADASGKDDPFPAVPGTGCGFFVGVIGCTDAAVYKYSAEGQLLFATYLAGNVKDAPVTVRIAPDGAVVVTGQTESSDFPVSAGAIQSVYGGPPAKAELTGSAGPRGDVFLALIDGGTGVLRASTYLGGPNADQVGETVLGSDGSVYLVPKWLALVQAQMPTTSGALLRECLGDPCLNGYAAHFNASLDRLLYATYLPGVAVATAKVGSDGSVYYAGNSRAGFVPTAGAYRTQVGGETDAIVARLDPTGSRLIFGTYLGFDVNDYSRRIATMTDGSVWVGLTSFSECCSPVERLVHLDAQGTTVLATVGMDALDLAQGPTGEVLVLTSTAVPPTADAVQFAVCPYAGTAYVRLGARGEVLFATYLPRTSSDVGFKGVGSHGGLVIGSQFEVVEAAPGGIYAGCMVDAANYAVGDVVSPGEIVTIFGSKMGPESGVSFTLSGGRLPTSLSGVRVLVNGEAIPLLYVSAKQINAVLPYSLAPNLGLRVQVERDGQAGNELTGLGTGRAGLSLFTLDGSGRGPAAAINEDGTINSTAHPAAPGSRVMLFGTGGGTTSPASAAGEVTPLELRRLTNPVGVRIADGADLVVEFAGAAPGLVAGVTQINVKLPDAIPQVGAVGPGLLQILPVTPNASFYPNAVTLYVSAK